MADVAIATSAYREAVECATSGSIRHLRDMLDYNPLLVYTITLKRRCRVKYGLIDELARASCSLHAIDTAVDAFVKRLSPEREDLIPHSLVACYSDRGSWQDCYYEPALKLIKHVPTKSPVRLRIMQSLLPRWTKTSLNFVDRESRVVFIPALAFELPLSVGMLMAHIEIGHRLLAMDSVHQTFRRRMLLAASSMCGVLLARAQAMKASKNKSELEHAAVSCEGLAWQLLNLLPGTRAVEVAAADCMDSIILQIGDMCVPPFLHDVGGGTLSTGLVSANLAHQLCDFFAIGVHKVSVNLNSLLSVARRLPLLMSEQDSAGNNGYSLCVLKFGSLSMVWKTPAMFQAYKDIMGLASCSDLLCLSMRAKSTLENMVAMAVRVVLPHQTDIAKVAAVDQQLLTLLQAGNVHDAFGKVPRHTARIVIANVVRVGLLQSAEMIIAASIRREPVGAGKGRLGWTTAIDVADHLQLLPEVPVIVQTVRHAHVAAFAQTAARLSATSLSKAVELGACRTAAMPFFCLDHARCDRLTLSQRKFVWGVATAMAAARMRGKVVHLPSELVLVVLSMVKFIDLGPFTGTFHVH